MSRLTVSPDVLNLAGMFLTGLAILTALSVIEQMHGRVSARHYFTLCGVAFSGLVGIAALVVSTYYMIIESSTLTRLLVGMIALMLSALGGWAYLRGPRGSSVDENIYRAILAFSIALGICVATIIVTMVTIIS